MPESTRPNSTKKAAPVETPDLATLYAMIEQPMSAGKSPEEVIAFRESDQGKRLASWVKEKYKTCQSLRAEEQQQWNLNLAMYNGQQWVNVLGKNSPDAGRLGLPLAVERNREKQTINRIKPIVRTEHAKFISQRPSAQVLPASDDDEDIKAAESGQQIWRSTYDRRDLAEELSDATWWMCITGNGFLKTTWNPSIEDKEGQAQGDIEYGSVSPYELFFPDLKLRKLQAQPYVIHAYAKPVEWLQLNYADVLGDEIVKPTCNEEHSIRAASFAAKTRNEDEKPTATMLYELWVKPNQCALLPNGGMVVMIDNLIVDYSDNGLPYSHGDYPFTHFGHIKSDGFYYKSIIEDLIDLQRDYNKLRSQIAETRKKMGKAQILAQKGSIVASKITNEIGLVVEYKPGTQPPSPMPLQNIPQYILNEVDLILRDFEDVSGQHEISKGQTPAGVTAATAIAYLQESDDSFLLPSFKGFERAVGQIAKQTLQLIVQYWDLPRLVKVGGKDEVFSTKLLSGADIRNATDIRIDEGSSIPESTAAQRALIMDLMTNGIITDTNEGLDMMQIGATKKLLDTVQNDKRQAQRENIKFGRLTEDELFQYEEEWNQALTMQGINPEAVDPATGQPLMAPLYIPVNSYDTHEVHIEEHNRWRRTQAFEVLPDAVKALVEAHVEQHKAMMRNNALEDMLSQIPSDGSIAGPGGTMDEEGAPEGGPDMETSPGMESPEFPNAAPGAPSDAEAPPMEA